MTDDEREASERETLPPDEPNRGEVDDGKRAKRREALKWGGAALIGGLIGFAAGTVTVAPSDGAGAQAGAEGQEPRPVCERWCYSFEPIEVLAGDTVRGRVELGLDIERIVEVEIFGIEASEAAARAFTYEWTRTGAIELCVEPRAGEHGRIFGDLCTRDSCLARALKDFGHAKQQGEVMR